jgi:hypothetical protein
VSPVAARSRLDAELRARLDELDLLLVAAQLHHRRARLLLSYHQRRRCVGLRDLIASAQALESSSRVYAYCGELARRIALLYDARRGDGLATVEAEIRRALEEQRSPSASDS